MDELLRRFWPVGVFGMIMVVLAFALPGTCDEGDSIFHYLYARDAFQHPENFFNHWAKPVYVLLFAPFAQLGFVGVKLLNVVLMAITMWCTIRIAEHMQAPAPWLAGVAMGTMPELLHVSLSGLTEPLFAVILAFGVLCLFENKSLLAVLMLSFLPFVRSEGLIVLGVVGMYLLVSRQWKYIPLLAIGHVVYGLAGWPFFGDPLWVIRKIPYARIDGFYGSGSWLHFFDKSVYYWGWWIDLMVLAGLLLGAQRLLAYLRGHGQFPKAELWLIYGVFCAFFGAHVVFWALGLFNSFGLTRVMVGIAPLTAIIAAALPNEVLSRTSSGRNQPLIKWLFVVACLVSMWLTQGFAKGFFLKNDQLTQNRLADDYRQIIDSGKYFVYADAVYLGHVLNLDLFGDEHGFTGEMPKEGSLDKPTIVFWDDWYSVVEHGTTMDQLMQDKRLALVELYRSDKEWEWPERVTAVFMDTANATSSSYLYYNNFEQAGGDAIESWGNFSKRSLRLNKDNAFGSEFRLSAKELKTIDALNIEYDILMKDTSNWEARLVLEARSATDSMLQWNGFALNKQATALDDWYTYNLRVPSSSFDSSAAYIVIYPWNPSEIPVWIDNMEIKWE